MAEKKINKISKHMIDPEYTQEIDGKIQVLSEDVTDVTHQLADTLTNVKNFPVIIPEVDDTGRIQRAIDASSGVVLLPARDWKFTSLNLKKNTIIRGISRDNTMLTHTGSGVAIKNNDIGAAVGNIVLEDLRLVLNTNTTVGIDFSRVYTSQINRVTIVSGGSTGRAIKCADGVVLSSYYNTFYDVSINGYVDGVSTLAVGFDFSQSANSTRLINCRTNYVKNPIKIAADYTNHIVVFGGAFEQFDVGIESGGVGCLFLGCRFENAGGTARGIGIKNTSPSNTILGNFYTNILTPVENATGGFTLRFDYNEMETKYLSHSVDGGWKSNMDMRNLAILNPAYIKMQVRQSEPLGATHGSIAYADGISWAPYGGGVEGLFAKKTDGKWMPATQIKVSNVPSSGIWQKGEILYNSSPIAGGYVGWVCVTTGNPGIWKPFGQIGI